MQMLNSKWTATLASIWIMSSCGATYTFGIYSSILKSSQNYNQSTLDAVSVFKDIGADAGVFSGLLYSAVTLERNKRWLGVFGSPWVVHAAGVLQCFFGYFMIWASVVGLIPKPPIALMCFFMWTAAHAQNFFSTANVVTGVHNFGDYSGTIVGIMKGFLGLSGAILIHFYDTFFKDDPSTFILILALTPSLISLSLMTLVRNYNTNSKNDKKHLNSFSTVALTIAAYLTIIIILKNIVSLSFWIHIVTFIILLLLVVSPLRIALKATKESSDGYTQALSDENIKENLTDYRPLLDSSEIENLNLAQAVCTVNFWLLFVAMFCGLGSGLATINNVSQVGESLGYTEFERNSLVSLLSIWNFLGRVGAGFVSDIFLHRKSLARPLFMAITLSTMAIGLIIIATGFSRSLYLGSILVGISYGSQWSLMPTICSEIFGLGHMGTIYNTIAIASPLGSYTFSVRVIGYIYDKKVAGKDNLCYGTGCFRMSFLIMALVGFVGFIVALVLFFRTRRFYQTIVLRRIQKC